MKIEDIVALSKAGYSSQQISMMAQAEAMQPKEEPKQEPPKQEPPKQEPPKQEPPKQEQNATSYEALMAEVLNLKTAIQQNNINNSNQPEKPAPTADDILAEIIMPKPTNIKEEK